MRMILSLQCVLYNPEIERDIEEDPLLNSISMLVKRNSSEDVVEFPLRML